jgi:glucose-6-phosphate 1-dehydrogenase
MSRSDALVLFGATGDLARKKLFSSLYRLAARGRLDLPVIGVALSDWDNEQFVLTSARRSQRPSPMRTPIWSTVFANG